MNDNTPADNKTKKNEKEAKKRFRGGNTPWLEQIKSAKSASRLPKGSDFKKISSVLTGKDRLAVTVLLGIIVVALVTLGVQRWYIANRDLAPAFGGEVTEGIIGTPRLVNPVLAQTNEADLDLSELLFSRLYAYGPDGTLQQDLATNIETQEDGKVYLVSVRDDATWEDGEPLTVDDIVFTLQIIQDPTYESPLRTIWQGVTVAKQDENTIKFTLQTPYTPFQHNLTFGVLPKHVWEVVDASNIKLSQHNTKPVGSGPYSFSKFKKSNDGSIVQYELERNQQYYGEKPFIKDLIFKYYSTEEELIEALNKREVDTIAGISPRNLESITRKNTETREIFLPQYFSLFFNRVKDTKLSDKKVREALARATNREQIINDVLAGKASILNSPVPNGLFAHSDDIEAFSFDTEQAKTLLDEAGWKDLNNDNVRSKVEAGETEEKDDAEKLEFTITTTDAPELIKIAELVQTQWQAAGVQVSLEILEPADIQSTRIRPREYDILLFGEIAGADPDLFGFWHSSQVKDPGLNLALYENATVDKQIEEARQSADVARREELYKSAQQTIATDLPVIFLYQTSYLTIATDKLMGQSTTSIALPAHRFSDIQQRFVKTTYVKKEE